MEQKQESTVELEADLESESSTKKQNNKKMKLGMEILIYILAIFLCAFVIPKYVIQRTIIDGDSMETTLSNENNVLVEKLSVKMDNLERYDIIVFYPYGKQQEDYYVKRIIGLPGETVQIKDAVIYINGEPLEENYGKGPITNAGIASEPLTLAEDEYFVLGDNRSVSLDSRYEQVGPVNIDNIEGRVILRIWPLSKFGTIN